MKDIAAVYWRKTYSVKAVRLTRDNIQAVAIEINAEYSESPNLVSSDTNTPVPNIFISRSRAFIGDWVVQFGEDLYVVFEHENFMRKFLTHSEKASTDEKYAKVFDLVQKAMLAQDSATYHGDGSGEMDLVTVRTTLKILEEL
jgi:hypothetical protein